MSTYIALFRGINVGGKNKINMKTLASLMEECGFQDIQTYIQSGNAVLSSKTKPNDEIAEKIEKQYGFKPDVIFLSLKDFRKAVEGNPFKNSDGKTCHFYFCKNKPASVNTTKLEHLKSETEDYLLADKVFYLSAPNGIGRSKLAASVEQCLGVSTTARNFNTINKLSEMVQNI